jgi:hypothetical protein
MVALRGFLGFGALDLDELRPGHLFWMPPGATWLSRDKARPFALVTPSSPEALATLVYGSTQETERASGAACIEVAPVREGLNRNGLRTRTFFYPGTLLNQEHDDLPPPSGYLGRSLTGLRSALRTALGIGRGSCLSRTAPRGSCRGRIVVLSAAAARHIRTALAVVLTEPDYSRTRNYQIILPVFSGLGERVGEHDLLVDTGEWLNAFSRPVKAALLPIPVTQSVWHQHAIARETEYVMDEDSLARIDRALCDYFSLPEPEEQG